MPPRAADCQSIVSRVFAVDTLQRWNLKSAKTENIRGGWCFVWGRAKTTLLLAVAIAASNIRLLRAWSKRTGDITDPLTTPDPEGHGFEEVDADGNPLRPTGPPGAAAA